MVMRLGLKMNLVQFLIEIGSNRNVGYNYRIQGVITNEKDWIPAAYHSSGFYVIGDAHWANCRLTRGSIW